MMTERRGDGRCGVCCDGLHGIVRIRDVVKTASANSKTERSELTDLHHGTRLNTSAQSERKPHSPEGHDRARVRAGPPVVRTVRMNQVLCGSGGGRATDVNPPPES